MSNKSNEIDDETFGKLTPEEQQAILEAERKYQEHNSSNNDSNDNDSFEVPVINW